MKQSDQRKATETLKECAIQAILDKKGHEVVSLDMSAIDESITDYFIVCHGNSTTQVKAIADNVHAHVKKTLKTLPWQSEGFQGQEWVLIDYVDVVVHVFLKEKRAFYQLEELWSDALQVAHTDEESFEFMKGAAIS